MIVVILGFVYCILHVCGGDPIQQLPLVETVAVFSTCVEVILNVFCHFLLSFRILHVCGGDPNVDNTSYTHDEYSPRVWR